MFLQFCQQDMKRAEFMKCFVDKVFCLETESEGVSDFAAQHQVNSVIKGQFSL